MDDSTLVTLQPSSTGQVGAELAQPASASPGESSKSGSHPGARRESKGTGSASATRIRRRNRLITSCLECRRRKLKCDRTSPCSNCTRHGRDCLFIASTLNSGTQRRIAELKERVGCLERSLENDIARQVASDADLPLAGLPTAADEFSDADDLADADADDKSDTELAAGPDDEKDLDPTPLTLQDAAYEDSADDEFTDLGIRMGRIRITDRIGGFFRPKLGEEVGFYLRMKTRCLPYLSVCRSQPTRIG